MTSIIDSVIEAMALAYLRTAPEPAGAIGRMKAALRAAEDRGYKLVSREPTEAMIDNMLAVKPQITASNRQIWDAGWDAAPGVGKP